MVAQKAKHTMRNVEYEAYAQSVLDNSDLVGEQYETLYDDLMLGKEEYANSDKKTRDLKLRDLTAMAGDYDDYKTLREEVAINLDDYSPAWQDGPEGQEYLKILKGDGKYLKNNNGRIGIEVDGEWRSISSIKQEIDANKIDKTAIDELEAFRIKEESSEEEFDRQKTRTSIMNSFVSKKSYNSLINDEIAPNKVFKVDLLESLMNNTYGDLGITDADFEGVEGVNSDGIIDADEAENIFAHLENDEPAMKNVLADYYTSYIQNNGGGGGNNDTTAINESYGYTNEQAKQNQAILVENGYDIEEDGVWGPKSQEAWEEHKGSDLNEGESGDMVDVLTMNDRANQLVEEGLIEKPKSRADLIKANERWEELYGEEEDYS
jgi:hypothetical protein